MACLYFHIPFCKRICGYCDFYRSAKVQLLPQVLEAMHNELEREHTLLHERKIKTIYFGGGTPSLVAPSEIERLITHARELFDCSEVEEITIEVNPDDINEEYIAELKATSVNRISIGVQSLDDEVLRFMGRRHSAEQAQRAVKMLQEAGYNNISVDIIFGVECATRESLTQTLQGVLDMGVQHISAYHLTIEGGSRFARMLQRGEIRECEEERSEEEFALVHNTLTQAGFEHYEVSNFALNGYRSRHNSSYWREVEYLGIGAGAHSYNGEIRRWCEQDLTDYIAGVEYDSERLSETDRLNEMLMTSLRCQEGFSLRDIEERFGAERRREIENRATRHLECGGLTKGDEERLFIKPEKFILSDIIITDLMV